MSVEDLTDPLAKFLEETRLRFDPRTAPARTTAARRREHPLAGVVREVLGLGYGERAGSVFTRGRAPLRARTTPSAGALYPFEVMVALRETDDYRLHRYDIAAGCLDVLGRVTPGDVEALLDGPVRNGHVEDAPPRTSGRPLPQVVMAVVGRPWLSMRKYGLRGYFYTLLDGGHAATNLTLAASAAGLLPTVRLRFDRRRAAIALGLDGRAREPLVLITCEVPADGTPARRRAEVSGATAVPVLREAAPAASQEEPPQTEEREAWQTLAPVRAYDRGVVWSPRHGKVRPVAAAENRPGRERLPLPSLPDVALGSAGEFGRAAVSRTSAKGFLPRPVTRTVLAGVLSGLRQELTGDHADGPAPRLRVLARDIAGVPSGTHTYDPVTHELCHVDTRLPSAEEVLAACQNQEVVRHAAALLVLHTPLRDLLGPHGHQALAEVHFRAASAAQRICLGAALLDAGVTCLGGFDSTRIGWLTGLDGHGRPSGREEVVYVLALGVSDPTAVKWDRAPVAYSHGIGDPDND
ncbi:hypothetical protein AB0L10_37395 [Streptomyces flaveolus]|uniref:hypothetical protein n=1 Tax=Streptomyces flaveolus TaxID=67297 RepID=UPI0034244C3E